jgi:flavin-dependent dehydrogenase
MPARDLPIVVVGAGPAGSVAARTLASKGRDVLLIDAGGGSPDRVEMLPSAGIAALDAVGMGSVLEDARVATECLGIVRLGVREDMLGRPGGRALSVYRPQLDGALRACALGTGARFLAGRLLSAQSLNDRIMLGISTAEGPKEFAATTVIDATGRGAAVARRLGASIVTFERLVAWPIAPAKDTGPWLDFMPIAGGWAYAIGGPLDRRDAWRIGRSAETACRVKVVDASARRLEPAAGSRWIAIGDASVAFDPICCQGLSHAVRSAIVASGLIEKDGGVEGRAALTYDLACRDTATNAELGRNAVYVDLPAGDHEFSVAPHVVERPAPSPARYRQKSEGSKPAGRR